MQSTFLSSYKDNIIFAVICLSGLLVLAFLFLLPLHEQSLSLDRKTTVLQKKTVEQRQLAFLLTTIDHKLAAGKHGILPKFKGAPLPMNKAGNILSDIKSIAKSSHLKVAGISPNIENKTTDWHKLPVKIELHGRFPRLRNFILDLLTLPYIKGIDRIKIMTSDKQLVFYITFTALFK